MATFVLVHGGGHGGWCYQFVARLLRAEGHEVYTPSLTGLAEREHLLSPDIDLDTQITDVVKLLHFEDLRDVILVGHSYGGMVITGIADRAADRIGHLVYLDAANPVNGQSLVDVAGPFMLLARQMGRVVDGVELVLFPGNDPMSFYGVTDPALIEWMKPKLTPHPWKCFEQKLELHNEDALWAIPQSHIICTSTIEGRDIEALKARSDGRVWDIDTGHDLMITEPDAVTGYLLKIAAL
ncbi:alpha/beta hydrolase [Sphingomonas sp. LaA6.9]|uniref:alpha/beta hydrolase n=1 Tax=Sphingomonas sp. LaA6.9 TaxID=2919914 RepID=UPI001F4FB1C3|nr:alpha/beta hydrolase [Sphingomonas sp. LaA6.9]MCJ8156051.1 alpha/beta hydrolase [Sphingomonas sp. LaA6.9]